MSSLQHSLIRLMMKKCKNFRFLSGGRNGLPALSWTQKFESRLEIGCSVLERVCVCKAGYRPLVSNT